MGLSLEEMALLNRYAHSVKNGSGTQEKSKAAQGGNADESVTIRGRKVISDTTGKEIPNPRMMTNASYGKGVATTVGSDVMILAKNRTRRYY